MRKKSLSKLLSVILLSCLLLGSCGGTTGQPSGSGSQPESIAPFGSGQTSAPGPQPESTTPSGSGQTPAPSQQTGNNGPDENDENVITLGVVTRYNDDIQKMINGFNKEQSQYKVKLVQYGFDNFIMNIMRGQGPDIFSLYDLPVGVLTPKGIFEDLTPYFASSGVVRQEDIFDSVWEAGTIGGKMIRLIPSFTFEGLVVEKGHTNNGGWTVADYLALAEMYPEGKITPSIADPVNLFLNDLRAAPELYVDWEAGTCSFDSSDFIDFLDELKKYSKKIYDISPTGTSADRLHKREYLTLRTQIYTHSDMERYLHLKTLLGDEFELAGYPGVGDEPYYCMIYKVSLAMNAFSTKKEGAWAFFEYLLSEPVQEEYVKGEFPARMDVLNQSLQNIIDLDLEELKKWHSYNDYTQGEEERLPFTEEDRQVILEMLGHVKRPDVMNSGDITYIILNELRLFFDGSKNAKDTAALIQNRVQLYLDEMK